MEFIFEVLLGNPYARPRLANFPYFVILFRVFRQVPTSQRFRSFREKVQSRLIESFLRTLFTNLVKSEVQFPSTGGNGTFPILGILYRRNLFLVVIIFLFLI